MSLGMQYVGSFQDFSHRAETENPLEEVWAQIARLATNECLDRLNSDTGAPNWNEHRAYVKVRIHQAVEFWRAAHESTLLTAPLSLYYSFLNLMRAYMALVPEQMPIPTHGLIFNKNADLLSCEAALTQGTFTQYLGLRNIAWNKGDRITLRDALGCIPEIYGDVYGYDPTMTYVQPVYVDARVTPSMTLQFTHAPQNFATNWQSDFPQLKGTCSLDKNNVLLVDPNAYGGKHERIGPYLHEHLYNNLRGGFGFSDRGVSGLLPGQYSNRRAGIHEKTKTQSLSDV